MCLLLLSSATILEWKVAEFLYRFLPLGDNATPTAKDERLFIYGD